MKARDPSSRTPRDDRLEYLDEKKSLQRLQHPRRDQRVAGAIRVKVIEGEAVLPALEEIESRHDQDFRKSERRLLDDRIPSQDDRLPDAVLAVAALEGIVEAQHADRHGRVRLAQLRQDRAEVAGVLLLRARDRLGG